MTDRVVRTVSFKPEILELLDKHRGDLSRSYMINRIIEKHFEERKSLDEKSFEMGQI